MKAILVIDVNDDTNFDEAKADITMQEDGYGLLLGNVSKKWYENVLLKPMPKKKDFTFKPNEDGAFKLGYNKCIDEILGEEE